MSDCYTPCNPCCGGAIATFVYTDWVAAYPEFSAVTEPAATGYFNQATLYLRNDGSGPIADVPTQTTLLYMLTSHTAWLFSARTNGVPTTGGLEPAPATVGRVSNASEGSVSVQLDMGTPAQQAVWFNQTPYGAMYWQATSGYRTMRYRPGRRRYFGAPFAGPWSVWGGGGPY